MKIVEITKEWECEVSCLGEYNNSGGCGSKFIINEYDLYPRIKNSDYVFIWVCPKCGHMNMLLKSEVPKNVQYNLLTLLTCNWTIWEKLKRNSFLIQIANMERLKLITEEEEKDNPNMELIEKLENPYNFVEENIKTLEKIKKLKK